MEIFRIAAIGVLCALLAVVVKEQRPDIAMLISVIGGVIILFYAVNYVSEAVSVFKLLMDKSNIDSDLLSVVLKIIGIGYITEFSASVCEDSGNKSLGDKIQFGGKILILVISLPLLGAVIDIILSLLK